MVLPHYCFKIECVSMCIGPPAAVGWTERRLSGYNCSMTIHIDATYRNGVIQPDHPLALPDDTPLHLVVVPKPTGGRLSPEEIIAIRPKSPRITVEEFDALIDKYSVSVGSLPVDFSREDIYSDHD